MAITAPILWLDGSLLPSTSASLPLMGHAAQRGSLVFDVGSFHGTARGPALFRARDHVARFVRSARIVGLELAFDEETLVRAAAEVVARSGSNDGLVRWSAFLDAAEPDLVPRDHTTHVAVAAQLLSDPPRRSPLRIAVFDDARKAPPEVLSPETKASGAYLGPMLARKRAIVAGADDVVLLDQAGDIAEAPIANVFAVVAGTLWTPPLGRILPGITRDTVLALARDEGMAIREERLPREAFATADEGFLTSTSLPIGPIASVNGQPLRAAPGPVTTRLAERIASIAHGAESARESWLTYVRPANS
jgi:branched-chain amino acid aminotransferase